MDMLPRMVSWMLALATIQVICGGVLLWSSISLSTLGYCWKIGEGSQINVWNEQWIRTTYHLKPITQLPSHLQELTVAHYSVMKQAVGIKDSWLHCSIPEMSMQLCAFLLLTWSNIILSYGGLLVMVSIVWKQPTNSVYPPYCRIIKAKL